MLFPLLNPLFHTRYNPLLHTKTGILYTLKNNLLSKFNLFYFFAKNARNFSPGIDLYRLAILSISKMG